VTPSPSRSDPGWHGSPGWRTGRAPAPTSLSGGIHNGAVSELRYDDGAWTIVSMNDESDVAGAR